MHDADKLRLFIAKADELRERRLLRTEINLGFHLSWSEEAKDFRAVPASQIDEEDLRSMLMALRMFIAKNEPININHILNICEKRCTDSAAKQEFQAGRRAWKERSGMGFAIVNVETDAVTGQELSRQTLEPEIMLDLWINGHYFHPDETKRKQLIALTSSDQVAGLMSRQDFIAYTVRSCQYICVIANTINKVIQEGKLDLT